MNGQIVGCLFFLVPTEEVTRSRKISKSKLLASLRKIEPTTDSRMQIIVQGVADGSLPILSVESEDEEF